MPGKGKRGTDDFGYVTDGHTFISRIDDRNSASLRVIANQDKLTPEAEARPAFEATSAAGANPALEKLQEVQALIDSQEYKKALAVCERAIQLDPTLIAAHMNKAAVLRMLKRPKEALAVYEHLTQLAPEHGRVSFRKAEVLRELKRNQEALAAYERATVLDPSDGDAQAGRGAMLARLGRMAEAQEAYQKARDIGARQPGHQNSQ